MKTKMSVLAVLIGAVLVGGCGEKQKKQLEQMTMDNENLAAQLRDASDQLLSKEDELARCQDTLSGSKNDLNSARMALETARKRKQLPTGWKETKGMIMTSLSMKVLFDAGSAKLKPGAAGNLKRVLSDIKRNFAGRDVYVIGNTDSDPIRKSPWKDNIELSVQRAASVGRYLIRQGMNTKNIVVGGAGEYRPLVSNATPGGRAKNRRVEFWVLKPGR